MPLAKKKCNLTTGEAAVSFPSGSSSQRTLPRRHNSRTDLRPDVSERVSRLPFDGVSNQDDWYNAFYDAEMFTDTTRYLVASLKDVSRLKKTVH
jgi:hypothetical protein